MLLTPTGENHSPRSMHCRKTRGRIHHSRAQLSIILVASAVCHCTCSLGRPSPQMLDYSVDHRGEATMPVKRLWEGCLASWTRARRKVKPCREYAVSA